MLAGGVLRVAPAAWAGCVAQRKIRPTDGETVPCVPLDTVLAQPRSNGNKSPRMRPRPGLGFAAHSLEKPVRGP